MKLFNIIALGALAVISLASCEQMRDELANNNVAKTDMGVLELGVSVKQPSAQTRAEEISTENFPVTITGTSSEVINILREYNSVGEVPATISLPVGTYKVYSHTPGEIIKKMDSPYYDGSTELTITKGITTESSVICKMKNSKIKLNYGDDFKGVFQSWNITLDDGSNTALAFKHDDTAPTPIYWYFDEDAVTTIKVNIRATTIGGNTVSESRSFKKENAAEKYDDVTEFFTGGDALEINMGTVTSSNGEVTGITVTTNITFEDNGETVEIPTEDNTPVNPEPEPTPDPEPAPADGPTLELPTDATYSISDESSIPASADALIKATDGLESIVVKITGGNEAFDALLIDLKMDNQSFITGVDLIGNSEFDTLLKNVDESLAAPRDGATEYTFPIGVFFTFLNMTGATDSGKAHEFNIVVTDKNGKTANGTYKVTITE